jgi:hypothetical protein
VTAPEPVYDPALDDQLATALEDTEAARSSGTFQVTNLQQASWAVRKIAQHRRRLEEAEATYVAETAELDRWITDQRRRAEQATEFLGHLLRAYHEQRLAEDNPGFDPTHVTAETWKAVRHGKTIRLAAGELVARKSPDRVEVDPGHQDDFIAWAEATGHDDLVNVTKRPALTAIKQHVGDVMEDGRVVHEATGEFMPGVTWADGVVRYSIQTTTTTTDQETQP